MLHDHWSVRLEQTRVGCVVWDLYGVGKIVETQMFCAPAANGETKRTSRLAILKKIVIATCASFSPAFRMQQHAS